MWREYLPYTNYGDRDRLKKIGAIYKKYNYLLSDDWYYFVDANLLGDYFPAPDPDDIYKAVDKWVAGDMEHEFACGESFDSLFQGGVSLFLKTGLANPTRPQISVDRFLSDPFYWATTGSSDAKRLYVHNGTNRVKSRKGKWASAMALSLAELRILFYSDKPQYNRASPKRELGKARMIIAGDMSNYLRMSYVSYWLEDVMRNNPHMSMFYNTAKQYKMWTEMVEKTGVDNRYYNMPTDESEYDHHITSKMISAMLTAIRELISNWYVGPYLNDMLVTMDLITKSIVNNGHVAIRMHTGRVRLIPITKGLLSGWRWTALLNTIANGGKLNAFRYVVITRTGVDQDPTIDYSTLGDDIRSRVRSLPYASAILDLYKETNFDVNPNKFFISKLTDEYLRKIALNGERLTGYPLRGVASLIFSNPVTKPVAPGETRIREMFANWLQVVKRMSCPIKVYYNMMIHDIAQGNGVKPEVVRNVIHARSTWGGCGYAPYNDLRVHWKPYKSKPLIKYETPPLLKHLNTHEARLISEKMLSGVDFSKTVKKSTEPFDVTFTQAPPTKIATYRPPMTSPNCDETNSLQRHHVTDGPNDCPGPFDAYGQDRTA